MKVLLKHTNRKHTNDDVSYTPVPINGRYVERMCSQCKTKKLVFGHDRETEAFCQEKKELLNSCYVRICTRCDGTRRYRYEKKYLLALWKFKQARVITLTFKDRYVMSRDDKRRREAHVRNLMKRLERKFTPYHIQYVRVLELVKKDDGYHYHYHIIVDMPYIEQPELSGMWNDVSGAPVVYIQILRNAAGVPVGIMWGKLPKALRTREGLRYITKYLSNPLGVKKDDVGGFVVDYEQYALSVYGSHFVEARLTRSVGQNLSVSEEEKGLHCVTCEQKFYFKEEIYVEGSIIEPKPPPSLKEYL